MVTARRAGRREWISLAVLTLPCLLYAMDLTVLNLAVPHLSQDLRPSSTELLWIVDIYGFVAAGSLVTMGTLGDRIGRRRLLLIGAAAFGVTSLLAAWSTSAAMLIAARALLGLAGATVAPSTLSLIRNMFVDSRQRTVAVSVWITSFSVGGAIGPLLGGVLLEWFWWGSVFLLAVPVMALLLVLGPLLLPEFRDPRAGRLDLVSAALSVAAVLAVIFGLKQLARDGLGWLPASSVVAGLAAGVLFVRRQQGLADPLLDLRLFRSAAFTTALTTNLLSFFTGFGALLFIAQYLQLVLGLSPLTAGLWMLPSSAGSVLGSMLTPVLARRVRPAFVMVVGLRLAAAGLGLFTLLGPAALALLVTGVGGVLAGAGPGGHPGHRTGYRGRTAGAGRGGVGADRDRGRVRRGAGHRRPGCHRHQHLPQPADRRPARRDPVGKRGGRPGHPRRRAGGRRATPRPARAGPGPGGPPGLHQGLHAAFAVSAAAMLGAAVLAAIQLRHLRPAPEPDGTEPDGAEPDACEPDISGPDGRESHVA